MKVQFYPLDVDTIEYQGEQAIRIFGRTTDGKRICVLDQTFKPYFWAIPKHAHKITQVKWDISDMNGVKETETIKKKVLRKEVEAIKITAIDSKDVPTLRSQVKRHGSIKEVRESDVPFYRRYLIDKKIHTLNLCEVEGEELELNLDVELVMQAKSIKEINDKPLDKPRTLAIDIETYNPQKIPREDKDPIVMVGFAGDDGFKKVITWKEFPKKQNYVEVLNSETELLERFKQIIQEYAPDYLVTYFGDGFDFPYISKRAKLHKVQLDINWDFTQLKVNVRHDVPTAKTKGLVHIDIFKFISRTMAGGLDTERYDLNSVAQELLGEGKTGAKVEELADVWDNHPERLKEFAEYNLQDTEITLKVFQKVLPGLNEFVRLVGQPIYEVCRMSYGQIVEWYLMRKAFLKDELAPDRPKSAEVTERMEQKFEGAFVFEPVPGIYENIAVFDFKSLYPTIIATHKLDSSTLSEKGTPAPETFIGKKKVQYKFDETKESFIPEEIKEIIEVKGQVSDQLKKDPENATLKGRRYALKVLANSFYGYLGFSGSKWYCIEAGASTAAYARQYIKDAMKKAEEQDFKVIYGDSLPYDRRIFIQTPDKDIKLIKIGGLYNLKINEGYKTLSLTKNNQVKFMPIKRVIRHNYPREGKLLKIITKYGSTIATNQHSIYTYQKGIKLIDAGSLKKGDNLISLTNPKINTKYKSGHIFDILDLDLQEYRKELRLYKDNLIFTQINGICPYCKKKYNLATHVYLKHKDRREELKKKSKFNFIGGIHARTGRIPRHWKLDNDLAWLLGFYCAEGSVSDLKDKNGRRKTLLSFGGQDLKNIKKVKGILDKKIGANLKIIKDFDKRIKKNTYYYRVQRTPIIALFKNGFGAGKGSEFKKVPSFILNAEEKIRSAFLQGYLEGDGNKNKEKRYRTKFTKICTKSKELAIGVQFLFKSLNHGNNYFNKKIEHVSWRYRKDKPKINTLRLQSARKTHKNFCLAEIKEIKTMPKEKYVYDLEVEGSHNFVDAEGMLLVHNTDSLFVVLENKTKEDAIKFQKLINKNLPGLMELELEGIFPRGIFVGVKSGEKGAKKKYALLKDNGKIKITGFETIRGDWSYLAKEVQNELLNIILKENNKEKAIKYVKEIIKEVKEGKMPLTKMIISRQLRKDLSDYEAVGPHVAIAKKMQEKGIPVGPGTIIQFIVNEGSGIIRERAKLPEESTKYDVEYYLKNQVMPAVDPIMSVLGYTKKDLIEGTSQSTLGDY